MTDLDGQEREALEGLMWAVADYRDRQDAANSVNDGWECVMVAYAAGRAALAARERTAIVAERCDSDAAREEPRVTHGRHCVCSACAAEDWTIPKLAPCGMHGPSCPREYAPIERAAREDPERPDEQEAKVAAANRYNPTMNHHGRTERNAFWKGWDEHREYVTEQKNNE